MADVEYEVNDGVAVLSLNRPETRNAQNSTLLDELDALWTRAGDDDEVRVIVLRANGKHFSSGHDISGTDPNFTFDAQDPARFSSHRAFETKRYLGYCMKWRNCPKPSIAVVQGACVAAGLLLVWPCDLIIASDDAFFSDPVVFMGIPGVEYHGHTWELGARKAKEMLFTGMRISAVEAERLGMVNRVVPRESLDDEAMQLAKTIAQQDPFALALTKQMVNQTLDIQGQSAAIQAGFNTHWLGHANALTATGYPILVRDVAAMKQRTK